MPGEISVLPEMLDYKFLSKLSITSIQNGNMSLTFIYLIMEPMFARMNYNTINILNVIFIYAFVLGAVVKYRCNLQTCKYLNPNDDE
jgi:hypothetical protein